MLKRSRWLLLKRPEKLTGEQRGRLAELVRRNLRTVRAYLLKEDFQSLWGYVSPYWAGQFLDRWCTRTMRSRLDPMKEVARMVALAPRPDSELVPSPGAVLQWRCRRLQRKGQSDHQTGVWVPHLRGTGSRFVSRTWRPARTKTHPQILLTRHTQMRSVFARQAIPMVWDYAESNLFCESSGSYANLFERQLKGFEALGNGQSGIASQVDVSRQCISSDKLVSTDPPYYDNIGYADLSDFFYVWLRRSLKPVFPELFATLAVPKAEELVATPYRHGGKVAAETFFLDGMTQALRRLAEQAHPGFPVTIYYAFKQSETKGDTGTASTGWETFLDAVSRAGFAVNGTWPIRTEKPGRMRETGSNALASSVVLVCRRRPSDAPPATRRDFLTALRSELPQALRLLQTGNVAPVDLAQAAIGPGMAVFTRYTRVLDAAGRPMSVRAALALINQTLDEVLIEQEGDFDADSRWALAWFEQHGFDDGDYGVAEMLSKAKNTSVAGMVDAGIIESQGGKVRLLRPKELPDDWDPAADARLTAWEAVHHLIRVLETRGETGAAEIVVPLGSTAETARELCYRLYTLCERKKRAVDALSYNGLVQSWSEITRLARSAPAEQAALFDGG